MATEKQFEHKVKKWLNDLKLKGYPVKFNKIWGSGYQKAGITNLICCINGIYFEVELKSSSGRPAELQKYNILLTNRSKGVGFILYPEGFDNFKKLVKGVIDCEYHIQELIALKSAHSSTSCAILTD